MTVYKYHAQTGEYQGEHECAIAPDGVGYLAPRNTTEQQPPEAGVHQTAIYNGAWALKADWRGVGLYLKADGSTVRLSEIGKEPDDTMAETEPPAGLSRPVYEDGAWREKSDTEAYDTAYTIEPKGTVAQYAAMHRATRNSLIRVAQDRIDRYNNQKAGGFETTESAETIKALYAYIAALREVPNQTGFPRTVVWPDAV